MQAIYLIKYSINKKLNIINIIIENYLVKVKKILSIRYNSKKIRMRKIISVDKSLLILMKITDNIYDKLKY